MLTSTLWLTMALALAADTPPSAGAPTSPGSSDAVVPYCQVLSIERQEVPGPDAGVLVEMLVKEGAVVTKGMELGRIDDREAKALLLVKQREYEAAEQEAGSDIAVRYQEATARVAEQALLKLQEANRGASKAVSEIEILRTKLAWDQALLGIEKEQEANKANRLTADAKKAEVGAAEVVAERRVLRAPFDGVVLRVNKHVGEWVAAGEPVIDVVRVDRLSIRGGLPADQWTRDDVEGRNVTVEFALPRGRVEKLPGKVVFVSPIVEAGKLNVWAEVDVPQLKGNRSGVVAGATATMTVHVNPPAKPAAPPTVAPRGKATSPATTKKG